MPLSANIKHTSGGLIGYPSGAAQGNSKELGKSEYFCKPLKYLNKKKEKMINQELKKELWGKWLSENNHLENYCTIECEGLDNNTLYFHPTFILNEQFKIRCQSDIGNKIIYACKFKLTNDGLFEEYEIPYEWIESVIIGFSNNQEKVVFAIKTFRKIQSHIGTLRDLNFQYVNDIILGNGLKEVTNAITNELRITTEVLQTLKK